MNVRGSALLTAFQRINALKSECIGVVRYHWLRLFLCQRIFFLLQLGPERQCQGMVSFWYIIRKERVLVSGVRCVILWLCEGLYFLF